MNYITGCDALIVSFIETMLTIAAGLVPLSKGFRSPVELFLIFVNLTAVAFFHHSFLCKVYQIFTCKILESN